MAGTGLKLMSILLVEYRKWVEYPGKVHGDPGGGITCCGRLTDANSRWVVLGNGSLYDVDCELCKRSLRAAGDLPNA